MSQVPVVRTTFCGSYSGGQRFIQRRTAAHTAARDGSTNSSRPFVQPMKSYSATVTTPYRQHPYSLMKKGNALKRQSQQADLTKTMH